MAVRGPNHEMRIDRQSGARRRGEVSAQRTSPAKATRAELPRLVPKVPSLRLRLAGVCGKPQE